jgi:phosphonatase-like hydrolase
VTTPQLVVLDLAGTTFDDGIDVAPAELNAVRGANKLHVFRTFALRRFGAGPEAVRATREGLEHFNEELAVQFRDGPVEPFPGVQAALETLRAAGLKLATNTGLNRPLAEAVLDRLRWHSGLFDAHICGDDVPVGRPAPYMIYLAMERAGVFDARAVVVTGDTPLDLQAGTNASAGGVVGVLTGTHDVHALGATRHTHLIPSVADLPALLRAEFGVTALTPGPSPAGAEDGSTP